jgi:hypothetical protein
MADVSAFVGRALDELVPPRPGPDRWPEIERSAAHRLRRRAAVVLAAVPVAAALAILVLAWPFSSGPGGALLERAAAAIGDGPVVHAVVQSGFAGTEIDLASGARVSIHEENELWYDPTRGVHDITRFAGVVQGDSLYAPRRVSYLDRTLAFLATDYRRALTNGTARLLGNGTVDGTPVYWIRVDTQMLPDVADGKLHEWAHDVAVAQDSLKPVATRETRDGNVSPDGISRVLSVESLGSGAGDFTADPAVDPTGIEMRFRLTGSLTRDQADQALGVGMLWAGASVDGLPLARIAGETRQEGLDRTTGHWQTTHTGITLFYGPTIGGGIGVPDPTGAHLRISETRTLDDQFQRGVRNYSPPEGKVLVFGTGGFGVMQSHGIHVFLEASSADLLLAAAKALAPRQ